MFQPLTNVCLPPNQEDSCWSLFVRLHKFLFGEIRLSSFSKRVTSTPPTARTGLHTCACRLDCTMHAPGVSWHKLALNKKSHRCRASTFLMGGEYIQHWSSPPTYQAPKKHQSVMLKPPHTALQAQNHPSRRKKRRVTSSLPLRRTKRKMDPALAGQPSVHVNIWEPWSTNMAPSSSQDMKPPRSIRNAAKATQQQPRNIAQRKGSSQW